MVTGGSGFIGQHLVDQLLAKGETVRIFDVETPPVIRAGVTFVRGSVTDRALVERVIDGARHVYHTAAIPQLWAPDPAVYQQINVDGTKIVLEAAVKAGVERVVHTSSSAVLTGRHIGPGHTVVDETLQTYEHHLFGHYARSKWRAESVASSFSDRLSIVIVMPTLPFGPGDRRLTPPTRMLVDFINGRTPAYMDCLLNIIDVRDVAAGHILACERGRCGQRYILNQHTVDMASFLQQLRELTGRTMPHWRLPPKAALFASMIDEAWSTLVTKRIPRAPIAGTCMGGRPVEFSNRLAQTQLGCPSTPLLQTLIDAVSWLSERDRITVSHEKPSLVFSGR